jgi:hypothetical protein
MGVIPSNLGKFWLLLPLLGHAYVEIRRQAVDTCIRGALEDKHSRTIICDNGRNNKTNDNAAYLFLPVGNNNQCIRWYRLSSGG